MEEQEKLAVGLPENAFRELKDGEEYQPVMDAEHTYPEVNTWSVTWGVLMAMLFSAAAAYLGLKVGQVFEAAIPIAIIAVGVSTAARRSKALGENIIIQSIGACSGAVVAGAIFTLPAIYILQAKYPEMSASFINIFISSLLGGIIGILFLIPFRKYFVQEMHGKYPFPEATATTQVLVSGAKGGNQAKPLIMAGLVGGLYDFIVATFGRQCKACVQGQHRCSGAGTGIHHRLQICADHLSRLTLCMVADHTGHVAAVPQRCAEHVGPLHRHGCRRHESRTDL